MKSCPYSCFPKYLNLDNGTLVLQVFLQLKLLTVKYPVGEITNPVTQADHTTLLTDTDVEGDVAVTENKVLYFGIIFQFLPRILDLVFLICTLIVTKGAMLQTAFL